MDWPVERLAAEQTSPRQGLAVLGLALGNRTRAQIIALLRLYGPQTGKQLADSMRLTPETVRHHLVVLRDAHIVDREEGRSANSRNLEYRYSLSPAFAPLLLAASAFVQTAIRGADLEGSSELGDWGAEQ